MTYGCQIVSTVKQMFLFLIFFSLENKLYAIKDLALNEEKNYSHFFDSA